MPRGSNWAPYKVHSKPWLPWFLSWPLSTFDSHGLTSGHQTYGLCLSLCCRIGISFSFPFTHAVVAFLAPWQVDLLMKTWYCWSLCSRRRQKMLLFSSWLHWRKRITVRRHARTRVHLGRETQQVSASTDGDICPSWAPWDRCLSVTHLGRFSEGQMGVVTPLHGCLSPRHNAFKLWLRTTVCFSFEMIS